MPAAPDRPYRVDLLLCGHHFRLSQWTLAAAGAVARILPGRLAGEQSGLALLWLALARSGSLWLALARSGSLWLALARSGSLWLALARVRTNGPRRDSGRRALRP